MIQRVREALKELVERFKINTSKQSTSNISMKNYKQITKQKPFKPQSQYRAPIKKQKKVKIYDHEK